MIATVQAVQVVQAMLEKAVQEGRDLTPEERQLLDALLPRPLSTNSKEPALTSKEAARRMNVRPETLCRWRQMGRGPPYVLCGGVVRYNADVIDAWSRGAL
jgi:hypothetical protein